MRRGTWTQLPDLPEPITHAGTTVVGTNIYLAGGYLGPGGNKYQIFGTTHVWKFDTVTLQWSAMPPLPEERGGGSLVALFGVLHFFGGADLQRLDVSSHWMLPLDGSTQWISAAPLPHPRNHLGGVALNGRIYAVGGETGQDSAEYPQGALECWDPATGAWTPLAIMPKPRSHIAGATMTMDNRIIVLGGEIAYSTSLADVIAYDAVTNTWESLTPLPAKRHSGVAAALFDRIYYSGKCSCTSGPGLTTTYVGDPQ